MTVSDVIGDNMDVLLKECYRYYDEIEDVEELAQAMVDNPFIVPVIAAALKVSGSSGYCRITPEQQKRIDEYDWTEAAEKYITEWCEEQLNNNDLP